MKKKRGKSTLSNKEILVQRNNNNKTKGRETIKKK